MHPAPLCLFWSERQLNGLVVRQRAARRECSMLRYSKLLLALAIGFVGTGGCSSRSGEDALPCETARLAQLQLAATGISADIAVYPGGSTFSAAVVVTNTGTLPTTNWEVDVQLNNGVLVGQPSNATFTQSGTVLTLRPLAASNNFVLAPGAKAYPGFSGKWNSSPYANPTIIAVRRDVGSSGSGGSSSGGAGGSSGKGGSGGTLTGGAGIGGKATGGNSTGGAATGGLVGSVSGGTSGISGGGSVGSIALGKTSTASSQLLPANPATYANDSTANTDWCASATGVPAYWRVDLGGTYDVTGTSLTWPAALSGYGYIIQASTDNIAFSNVIDKQVNSSSAQTQSDNFATRASYLGVQVTSIPSSLTRVCLRDFQAFGTLVSSTGSGGTSSTVSSGGSSGSGGAGTSGGAGSGTTSGGSGGSSTAGGTTSGGNSSGGTATTPIEFSFQLPKGVDRSRIAFGVTGGELWINDHAKVQAPMGVGGFSSISAVANGRVSRLGYYGEVQNLYSEGDVTLANRALVHGDLNTRGNLTADDASIVFGKKVFNAPIIPTEVVSWTVPFPVMAGEATFLQPDSGTFSPLPGAYNGFVVNRNAHLKLVAGVYYFNTLKILAEGYLDIDNSAGPVLIYVRNELSLGGTHSRTVAGRGLFIGYAGTAPVDLFTSFKGIVVAPNASLTLASYQSAFAGSYYAKSITVHQFNYVDHEPWTHDSLCAPTDACSSFCPCGPSDAAPCTANSNCQAGLSCTQYGYCACVPQCSGKTCGGDLADSCGSYCPMVCANGEIGCQRNTDCKEGSLCLPKGELKGFPAGTNICLPAICRDADPRKAGCGVNGADCGNCPACTPDCSGRNCGPDSCGGSCGTPAGDELCLGGVRVNADHPEVDHSSGFPTAIPTNFGNTSSEAGAIPSTFRVTDRGTASYTIPIQMPPGRHGLVPNLSLTYESTRSSGMLGLGWGIGGFSKIERCNRIQAINGKADPISLTNADAFCLDGVVLVAALDGSGSLKPAHTHDTELERFQVIRALGSEWEGTQYVGPSSFKVWTKDGHILTYGAVDDYNLVALGAAQTRVDGVVDTNRVHRAWHLTQIEDHAGNFASFLYERTIDDQGTTTEIVPRRVLYGQKQDPTSPGTHPYFGPTSAVDFTYVDNPKPTHHYVAGFLTYQTKLLSQIDTNTVSNAGLGAFPVTTYELAYTDPDALGPRLKSVTQCSRGTSGGAAAKRCLPATKIEYTVFGGYEAVGSLGEEVRCSPTYAADLDGDGQTEAICGGSMVKYHAADPSSREAHLEKVAGVVIGNGAQNNVLIMDVNRDGRDDVVSCGEYGMPALVNARLLINKAAAAGPVFEEQDLFLATDPSAPYGSGHCRLGDVDGDGLVDLIIVGPRGVSWKRQGTVGLEAEASLVTRSDLSYKAYPRIITADRDGDGDIDIFSIRSDTYEVLHIGDTTELPWDSWNNLFALVEPQTALDVNGDGLMDYLDWKHSVDVPGSTADKSYFTLLVNTGTGFVARPFTTPWICGSGGPHWFGQEAIVMDLDHDGRDDVVLRNQDKGTFGTCPIGMMRATRDGTLEWDGTADTSMFHSPVVDIWGGANFARTIDLNGDGVLDILFRTGAARVSKSTAPGLLSKITNGVGERISVTYDTSVSWPNIDGTPLPFAIPTYSPAASSAGNTSSRNLGRVAPLVASYRTDQVNPTTGAFVVLGPGHYFHYLDARMGVGGRGWYGFGERWVADVDAADNPVAETRTKYHNDAYWRAGLVSDIQTQSGPIAAGTLHGAYSRTVYTTNGWQRLTSSLSGHAYPWLRSQVVAEFEGGPFVLRRSEREWVPDNYGNVASSSAKTIIGEGDLRSNVMVDTQYHVDPARWLISLPELETTSESRSGETEYRQVSYSYSADGLVTTMTREPNRADVRLTTTYERDPVSRNVTKVTVTDQTGNSRSNRIVYDQRDLYPVSHVNDNGEVTEVQHDGRTGQLLTVMDPNGVISQRGYDPFGRIELEKGPTQQLLRAFVPAGSFATTAAGGQVWIATSVQENITPKGSFNVTNLDAMGRVVRTVTSGLNSTLVLEEFERDWAGRVVRKTLPHSLGSLTQGAFAYVRDVLGRVTATTAPDGRVTHQEYVSETSAADPTLFAGNAVSAMVRFDPNNLAEYRFADERGIPTQVVQFDASVGATPAAAISAGIASVSSYSFGPFGVPRSVTDADGEVTTFIADAIGRRTQIDSDSTGMTQTTYNAFGEVIDETDANGDKHCYSYDILGRPTAVRRPESTGACPSSGVFVSSWQYGTAVGEIGKLVSSYREAFAGAGIGTMQTYRYEVSVPGGTYAGRLKSVEQTVPGLAESLVTSYDYDGPHLGDVHYPSAAGVPFAVHYTRDYSGILTSVTDSSGSGAPATEYWKLLTDDEGQRIATESQGDGATVTTYLYNTKSGAGCAGAGSCMPGSLRVIRTSPGSNLSQSLQHFEYKYDAGGALQHIETYDGSISVGSTDFANDVFGRLHNQNEIGPIILHSTTYAYSPGGDIQSVTDASVGGTGTTESYVYHPSRPRLVESMGTTTYGYDLKGRQISRNGPAVEGASQSIEYNDLDLPERITVGGTQVHRFEYDAGGSRTVKRDPTTTTVYAGEHYRCSGATNPSSNTVSCTEHQYGVFVGDRLIAEITKDSTGNTEKQRYVHGDHLGSSTLITDETGTVIEKRSFKPFGQAKAAFTDTDLRAGFTGHEHDSELGLINMRGRMYDPKLRRFVTPDPFVTEPWNPAGLNRFAYVQNSPLNFVDPSGFEGEQQRGEETVTTQVVIDSQGQVCGIMGFNIYYTSSAPPEGAGSYPIGYPEMLAANQTHDSHLVRGDGSGQAPAQGPVSGSMAPPDNGGGTNQSGGTTQSTSGPTTSAGSHTQRSGDGSGQPSGNGNRSAPPTFWDFAGHLSGLVAADIVCGFMGCGDAGGSMGGGDPKAMSETEKIFKSALTAATLLGIGSVIGKGGANANTLHHIFGKSEHNLGPLLERFGGETGAAFEAMKAATESVVKAQGLTGVFETSIQVAGLQVTVRGAVVDGIVRIGTAFIP